MNIRILQISVVAACVAVTSIAHAQLQPILAVPISINNVISDPVLLQQLNGTGSLTPLPQIPGNPATLLDNPVTTVFSSQGELFVGNRDTGQIGADGTIARFKFDSNGNYIPDGNISGNGLSNVHGMAFGPSGELFAVSYRGSEISRFTFDSSGNAMPDGTVTIPIPAGSDHANLGVCFSPWGEMFVTVADTINGIPSSSIDRFLFDSNGNAIFNGSFTTGTAGLQFPEFNAKGELFAPDYYTSTVYRLHLRCQPQSDPGWHHSRRYGDNGVAFSPDGEMFVSHQSGTGLLRFLLDSHGNAIPNGQALAGNELGQVSIFPSTRHYWAT